MAQGCTAKCTSGHLLSQLRQLANATQSKDQHLRIVTERLLAEAFSKRAAGDKTLFDTEKERAEAGALLVRSLPAIETALGCINHAMVADKRAEVQEYRSGLQFMVDEFSEDRELHRRLSEFLRTEQVVYLEEQIDDAKDMQEYVIYVKPTLNEHFKTHRWWNDEK